MNSKVIFHIDVNSAFLSWEAVHQLKFGLSDIDIREIPSAIGGDAEQRHGIILAKSIPAKKYGVVTGESIVEALKKCPNLLILKPDFSVYNEASKKFMNILKEYSPDVEKYSIDEAFVDVSGTRRLFGDPLTLANTIKERIKNELGFTVNVGISDVKLLAKMASDFKKPDLIHTLFKSEIEQKMWNLPVEDLIFAGKSTCQKLHVMGIRTIGELANTDVNILKSHLKLHGEMIWKIANGEEISIVQKGSGQNKGYGNSTTLPKDIVNADEAKKVLLSLCENVSNRLRVNKVQGEVISVSIKNNLLKVSSHQRVLVNASNITNELHSEACRLFDELWDGAPIRLLGVQVQKVKEEEGIRQINMFDTTDYEKLENVDKAIDKIRTKYGMDSVRRASFINNDKRYKKE